MSWRGKLLGGSLGSFLGPWGALAGATAGHVFVDRKEQAADAKQRLKLLALTAGALYEFARVDGRYTPREDAAIRTILTEMNAHLGTGLQPHELTFLIDDANRLAQCLARLAATVRGNPPLAQTATMWLWRVSVCDGDLTPPEQAALSAFIHSAGIPEDMARNIAVFYRRGTFAAIGADDAQRRSACTVLGIPYEADAAQIKSAYRLLSQKYHPDKHADLDPDIRALTAEKFAQIKAAYDALSTDGSPSDDAVWYVKAADSNQLVPPAEGMIVRCYLCRQKIRMSTLAHLASARCPVCQALVAFERDLAECFA
jgi:uncharacterized tellurite resistance protein B-like protein